MPFSPWKEHQDVQFGFCVDCGMPIPNEALVLKDGKASTYSHNWESGEPVFCPKPGGRSERCSLVK